MNADEDKAIRKHTEMAGASAMQRGHVVDLTSQLAMSAASLSLEHSLPMAESIILASARAHEAVVWTQDIDFKGLANVKYFPKRKRPSRASS